MDREQEEIQLFLGFFGVLKESCNILSSSRKIFIQITLSLIIPLSFIYLVHIQISELLFTRIMHNEYVLSETLASISSYNKLSDVLTSEWIAFFLFKIGYFVFFAVLALPSTSAVIYTIACIYIAKAITLRKVMKVVPKVWKRVIFTFIWSFNIVFAYNNVSVIVLFFGVEIFKHVVEVPVLVSIYFVWFLIVYLIGFLYITIIWHLAMVVSVLEESYGLNAMTKSQDLIKGNMGISAVIFSVVGLCFFRVQAMFESLVVLADGYQGLACRIGYGIICLVLLSIVMLFGFVTQTVIYFVCKSYHREHIDKSALADHLAGCLGEYVPLKFKDFQLEQFDV